MSSETIHDRIKDYIQKNFVFEENGNVGDDQSLLKSGVVDSTGILELIAFAEEEFNVRFDDKELVADNFDTINRVTACITRKLIQPSASRELAR
ncbi:acyl carrier protein [bacterium]|nr:MAG: acyl carrier protein [bacterium]